MAELVDAPDSKSGDGNIVLVRNRPGAPLPFTPLRMLLHAYGYALATRVATPVRCKLTRQQSIPNHQIDCRSDAVCGFPAAQRRSRKCRGGSAPLILNKRDIPFRCSCPDMAPIIRRARIPAYIALRLRRSKSSVKKHAAQLGLKLKRTLRFRTLCIERSESTTSASGCPSPRPASGQEASLLCRSICAGRWLE